MSKINFSHAGYNTKFLLKGLYFCYHFNHILYWDVDFHLIIGGVEENVLLKDFENAFDFLLLIETAVELVYFFLAVNLHLDKGLHEFSQFLFQL